MDEFNNAIAITKPNNAVAVGAVVAAAAVESRWFIAARRKKAKINNDWRGCKGSKVD